MTPPGSGSRLRARLILAATGTATALLLAEVAVRTAGRAPEIIPLGLRSEEHVYRRSENPVLSYEFKPGYRGDGSDPRHSYRYINAHGFRDVERERAKPEGVRRILLLGDSVVAGYGVPGIEQLMHRRLEQRLSGEGVEVLNLAVTGYCTRAEVEMLRARGLAFEPDAVILVFVENDFRNFNPEALGADGLGARPAAAEALFKRSHLFRLAALRFNWFGFGQETDPARWNRAAIGDNNVPEGLALLRELAERHRFRPLVAIWPTFGADRIVYAKRMLLPGTDTLIVERLAARNGLPVAGLRDPFIDHREGLDPRPAPSAHYTIGDQMHPSPAGHDAAAEILHRLVFEHGLLDPDTPLPAPKGGADRAVEAARSLGTEPAHYGTLHYNQAVDHYQAGQLIEALEALDRITPEDELNFASACVMRAVIYLAQDKSGYAEAQARLALEAEPGHFQAYLALADALQRQARWGESIPVLQRATALDPGSLQASNGLALAFARSGRFDEARAQYRRSLQIDSSDENARSALQQLP